MNRRTPYAGLRKANVIVGDAEQSIVRAGGQTYWPLTEQLGADHFDEQTVDVGGDRILVARRGGGIHRWRLGLFGGDLADGDVTGWVRRVDGGQGCYMDERIIERDGLAGEFEHNPTMLGGYLNPFSSGLVRSILSPTIYHRVANHGSTARIVTCTVPFEYDPNGWQGPTFDHGGDSSDSQALWVDWRMLKAWDINWRGQAGVHRVTDWSYYPYVWSPTDGPMVAYRNSGVYTMDHYQEQAEFFDPLNGLATDLPSWGATTSGAWYANALDGTAENTAADAIAYPFTGRVGGAIMSGQNASAGIDTAVGFFTGLKRGKSDQLRDANHLVLLQGRNAASVGEDTQRGQICQILHKSLTGRAAGWIGHQYWVVNAATVSEIRAVMRQLAAEQVHETLPEWCVPQEVIDGLGDLPDTGRPR